MFLSSISVPSAVPSATSEPFIGPSATNVLGSAPSVSATSVPSSAPSV